METTHVAIIGAGPHGLAAAAHLRRAGVECLVLGDPMSFWREMPRGMLLRSNWTATSIAEHDGPLSLQSYSDQLPEPLRMPLPLEHFESYGSWVVRQVAPDADPRHVRRVDRSADGFTLSMTDGSSVAARRVVVAAGIAPFVHMPAAADGLPPDLVSHASDHRDLGALAGRSVLVVGLGQSALESAALLHEGGAQVEVVARRRQINWLHGGKYHRRLGPLVPLFYAPTDVGPLGLSRLVAAPHLFRRLPRSVQDPLAYRAIRPAAAAWLRPRLADVALTSGRQVSALEPTGSQVRARLDDGSERVVDHVLCGTGYRVDVSRYDFLDQELLRGVRRQHGYPVLSEAMESSTPGLHFLGAPAAWSWGPTMRFVAGGWFGGRTLTERVVRSDGAGVRLESAS
jgi:hypothetical protein